MRVLEYDKSRFGEALMLLNSLFKICVSKESRHISELNTFPTGDWGQHLDYNKFVGFPYITWKYDCVILFMKEYNQKEYTNTHVYCSRLVNGRVWLLTGRGIITLDELEEKVNHISFVGIEMWADENCKKQIPGHVITSELHKLNARLKHETTQV